MAAGGTAGVGCNGRETGWLTAVIGALTTVSRLVETLVIEAGVVAGAGFEVGTATGGTGAGGFCGTVFAAVEIGTGAGVGTGAGAGGAEG